MEKVKPITFRPHHFLCALCFQGKGYSANFISNFKIIMAILNGVNGDNHPIIVTAITDAICTPCPNRLNTTCTSQTKIDKLDQAHASALRIQPNDQLTWGEAKTKIKTHIDINTFHRICKDCEWKQLGICESAISTFLES